TRRAPAAPAGIVSFRLTGLAEVRGSLESSEMPAPGAPIADHATGLVELSLRSRLRISSAYRPPSAEWLTSSRNAPNWVGLIVAPRCAASIESRPGPASCAIAPAPSAPEYVRTSSMRPETKSGLRPRVREGPPGGGAGRGPVGDERLGLGQLAVDVERDRLRRGVVDPGQVIPLVGLRDHRGVGGDDAQRLRRVIGGPGERELVGVTAQLQEEAADL